MLAGRQNCIQQNLISLHISSYYLEISQNKRVVLQAKVTDNAPVLDGFKAQSFLLGSTSPRVTVREGFDSVSPKQKSFPLFYKEVAGQEGSSSYQNVSYDALGLPEYASRLTAGWEHLSSGWIKREDKRGGLRFRLLREGWRSSARSRRRWGAIG